MKPYTYLLPCAAAVALLFTSCEKPATTSTTPPAEDTAMVSDDNYPMKTCPVSGEELGSMGDPVIVEHERTTVKLCCKSCIKKFNADPEKYTTMVREAEKQ